jgi:membrane protein insertase Oxa1/YidC/SpoIIIJ
MSAVATSDAANVNAPSVHLVDDTAGKVQQMHDAEQKRWMVWFGIPALIASVFVGMTFATGDAWWLGLAITTIIVDIFVLVWLAMSSDTNGLIEDIH